MNGEGEMKSVRLWYRVYRHCYATVCVNEAAAAAWTEELKGSCSTIGVEFANGRFLPAEDWELFCEMKEGVPANELEFWRKRPRPEGASW